MSSPRTPAVGFVIALVGTFVFAQAALGGGVDRLLSYAEPGNEPDNAGPRGSAYTPSGRATRKAFVARLKTQVGDRYLWGGEIKPGTRDPNGYDCSEYVEWGVESTTGKDFPDGSANQIAHCKKITVARALRTVGALLYKPGHIAVSMGDGKRVIEAQGTAAGVGIFSASGRGWTTGGLIPELA